MFLYAENMMKFAFSENLFEDDIQPGHAIMGIPFDSTTSYKAGSRYGPKAVREASYNFELYNFTFNTELSVPNYDIGDVQVDIGNYENTNEKIIDTIVSVMNLGLRPIAIGGEHTISNGIAQGIYSFDEDLFHNLTVVHLDAHFDMRNEYFEEKYSHASVLRRIHELNPKEIIQLGIRSAQYDEFQYVKGFDDISYYTSHDIQDDKENVLNVLKKINTPIYLTVDMDVLDPAYAPSVGTPAPCGITPRDLEDIISVIARKNTIALDVVEVSSDRIGDQTSINAAKVIYDYLSLQDI